MKIFSVSITDCPLILYKNKIDFYKLILYLRLCQTGLLIITHFCGGIIQNVQYTQYRDLENLFSLPSWFLLILFPSQISHQSCQHTAALLNIYKFNKGKRSNAIPKLSVTAFLHYVPSHYAQQRGVMLYAEWVGNAVTMFMKFLLFLMVKISHELLNYIKHIFLHLLNLSHCVFFKNGALH